MKKTLGKIKTFLVVVGIVVVGFLIIWGLIALKGIIINAQ